MPSIKDLGQTEHLSVRIPRPTDVDTLVGLWTDPQVTAFIGGPRDAQMVREHFDSLACDPESFVVQEQEWWWTIVERASNELVGLVSLITKEIDGRSAIELGFFIRSPYWRRGYATQAANLAVAYAFEQLDLDALVAIIDPENKPSIGVAMRLGMRISKRTLRPDGARRLLYELRRDTWNGRQTSTAQAVDKGTHRENP